ncbi:MAG TPA: hypothetical protein VFK89_01935 [Actinomycetota bacterium]|nr:hypothetical protein [Actinomycetota bacterium]
MSGIEIVALVAGLFVVIGTAGSLIRTLVVPRALVSRLSVVVARRFVRAFFVFLARRFRSYEVKDKILALSSPVSLIVLLVVWFGLFLLGYGLILWSFLGGSLGTAIRESGSSMLTLGISATQGRAPTVVDFAAGLTGLIVIALQIAYLPTIYSAFNRRETLVTMLQSRAGAPAWGPEILARHELVGLTGNLPAFYNEWERWSAEVAESHTTYPVLVWFRSPHPLRSWILALLSVMDSAALYLAMCPTTAPTEARLCLRMGFTSLRYIADVINVPYDPDPFPTDPIALSYEEYLHGVERLNQTGFPMERSPEEAWDHFKGWRVNYESIAYEIANRVVAPPGPWSGERLSLRGVTVEPQRPPDRRPGDVESQKAPKITKSGRHA